MSKKVVWSGTRDSVTWFRVFAENGLISLGAYRSEEKAIRAARRALRRGDWSSVTVREVRE